MDANKKGEFKSFIGYITTGAGFNSGQTVGDGEPSIVDAFFKGDTINKAIRDARDNARGEREEDRQQMAIRVFDVTTKEMVWSGGY